MSLFDWMATKQGMDLVNAVTLLLVSLATYFSWRTHVHTKPPDEHP